MPQLVNTFLLLLCGFAVVNSSQRSENSVDPVNSVLCRATCLYQLLEPEDAKEDGTCVTEPDCIACWENCGILAAVSNTSQEILCTGNQCHEGCETACDYFQSAKSRTPSMLVFPGSPKLEDNKLEWAPVPNASLYSVVLVYTNRTKLNVAQTVSSSLKIPKLQLIRVIRIVVIAVNYKGAVGLANFNIPRKMVKKNINSTSLSLENVLSPSAKIQLNSTLNFSSIHNQDLWITQNQIVRLNKTFVKTNVSWNFKNKDNYHNEHQYMVKWWVPDFNEEGKSIINGSQSMEMIYRLGHICLVKVKVLTPGCSKMESQIIVLKRKFVDPNISIDYYTIEIIQSFLLGSLVVIAVIYLIKTYFYSWKLTKSTTMSLEQLQK